MVKKILGLLMFCLFLSYATPSSTYAATLTKLTMSSTTITYASAPTTLSLTGTYSDKTTAAVDNSRATWTSSNTNVATVANGAVTFTGYKGTTTITAAIGTVSAKATANISYTIAIGDISFSLESVKALAIVKYTTNFTTQPAMTWASSNTTVAKVDSSGTVTFTGMKGQTNISATYGGVTTKKSVSVSPTLKISSVAYKSGSAVVPLTMTASYGNSISTTVAGVTWTSSKTEVATVSGSGIVYTGKPGSTEITGTYGSQTAKLKVTVDANFIIPVVFEYSSTPISLSIMANYGSVALVKINSADVTWASSDTKIATVDSSGKVTFTGVTGTVKITATVFGKYKTIVETYVDAQ